MITVDFETKAIQARPAYPPEPVGVSIKIDGKAPRYYAWGHPSHNNSTKEEAHRALCAAWRSKDELLFHNGKFDVDVAEVHFGLPRLPWHRYHDTMFSLYLHDPHAPNLELKSSAARILGIEPEERDAVREWLIEHRVIPRSKKKDWGAFICEAPGNVVGRYANGDVDRTYKLHRFLQRDIARREMGEAYDRERRLMPILLDNEREGIRVAVRRLEDDIVVYQRDLAKADAWIRKKLRTSDLNVDSDGELAEALHRAKQVTEWTLTQGGQRSVSKKNLGPAQIKDKQLAQVLAYRSSLATCLGTFAVPWLELAKANGGTLHTSWNQVRNPEGYGTRTGRPSTSKPSLLNVPKSFEDKGDGYRHPAFLRVKELPLMRSYLLPDQGGRWLHRDYNQQELRLVAHFEGAELRDAYVDDPTLDTHDHVQHVISELLGRDLPRRPVKDLNFGYVYGMALRSLAAKMGVPLDEAKALRQAQMMALPGLKGLSDDIKELSKQGLPIVTWGGREYYVEPSKFVEKFGRVMSFEYKLLNYLIQGSAADVTKEAVVRHHDAGGEARFLVTVYDEINASAPMKTWRDEMELLRECMEGIETDVPMLSDGKAGTSWGTLKKLKEKR